MHLDQFETGGISLERLIGLCAVVRHGTIARAAGGEPARQSLLSRQMSELEGYFGAPLFKKEGRTRVVNDRGRAVAAAAGAFLGAMGDVKDGGGVERPTQLTIGAGTSVIRWGLFPLAELARALARGPLFRFENLDTREVIQRLRDGRIDLGVIDPKGLELSTDEFSGRRLVSLEWNLYAPREILRQMEKRGPCALDGHPMGRLSSGGRFETEIDRLLDANGVRPRRAYEYDSSVMLAEAMQCEKMLGVLPAEIALQMAKAGYGLVQFEGQRPLRRSYSIFHSVQAARIRPAIGTAADAWVQSAIRRKFRMPSRGSLPRDWSWHELPG